MAKDKKIKLDRATKKSCIVIGGGLAGLAAAYRMRRNSWEVTVLEARERLGGRVLTHTFKEAPKLNCELGGEWIGKDHKKMRQLCRTFKLKLQNHHFGNSFWNEETPAQLIPPDDWCMSAEALVAWTNFKKYFAKLRSKQLAEMDKLDWWTVLKEQGFGHDDLLRRDLMDSTDFGETIRMNSAYTAATEYISTDDEKADDTDEMDSKVIGGNSRLVDTLEAKIGVDNIYKNQTVAAIWEEKGEVHVRVKDSACPYVADYCVCAIPARCLTDIKWPKRKPVAKLAAAQQLQYSRITKTAVLCTERFWPKGRGYGFSVCTSLASDYCFESTFGQRGKMGILCSYAVGDKADDIASSPKEDLKFWIVEDVANSHNLGWPPGESKKFAVAIKQEAWQSDHYTKGAYAFYRPGQWFTIRKILAKRFGRIYFAGEHIADAQGFMEGAVQTGQQAADDIMNAHRRFRRRKKA
jgi:monoamine oxidase